VRPEEHCHGGSHNERYFWIHIGPFYGGTRIQGYKDTRWMECVCCRRHLRMQIDFCAWKMKYKYFFFYKKRCTCEDSVNGLCWQRLLNYGHKCREREYMSWLKDNGARSSKARFRLQNGRGNNNGHNDGT